ncbi:MAG: hypothetical protein L0227_12210 [Chloroflexi bacterium]|nr:hypothetical protein [Chloroflexota bacterium]
MAVIMLSVSNSIRSAIVASLVVAVAAGCNSLGASPRPTTPANTAATPEEEFPGRSHAPRDPVAVFETDPFVGLITPDEAAHATALALADPAVQARLAGARYAVLYVTTPPEPSKESKELDPQTLPEVVVYDYTSDRWLEIPVDISSGEVRPFKERDPEVDGRPPITDAEAAVALRIALADAGVAGLTARGFQPDPRPVRTGSLVPSGCVTARCVLVVFHESSSRRSAFVEVDLGAEQVVGTYEE